MVWQSQIFRGLIFSRFKVHSRGYPSQQNTAFLRPLYIVFLIVFSFICFNLIKYLRFAFSGARASFLLGILKYNTLIDAYRENNGILGSREG